MATNFDLRQVSQPLPWTPPEGAYQSEYGWLDAYNNLIPQPAKRIDPANYVPGYAGALYGGYIDPSARNPEQQDFTGYDDQFTNREIFDALYSNAASTGKYLGGDVGQALAQHVKYDPFTDYRGKGYSDLIWQLPDGRERAAASKARQNKSFNKAATLSALAFAAPFALGELGVLGAGEAGAAAEGAAGAAGSSGGFSGLGSLFGGQEAALAATDALNPFITGAGASGGGFLSGLSDTLGNIPSGVSNLFSGGGADSLGSAFSGDPLLSNAILADGTLSAAELAPQLASEASSLGGGSFLSKLAGGGNLSTLSNLANIAGPAISGLFGSSAAKKAAAAQAQAAAAASASQLAASRDANALQKYIYDQNRADATPWRASGVLALDELNRELGLTPGGSGVLGRNFTMADYQEDPGYQFRLEQGNRGVENSAAAKGSQLSGATLKALTRFNQNTASDEFNNAFNRFNTQNNQAYNRLAGISGTGQVANQQIAQGGQNYANQFGANTQNAANNIANNTIGAGNADAAGRIGSSNAWNTAIGQGFNLYNQNRIYDLFSQR